jgi:hypothetical protein
MWQFLFKMAKAVLPTLPTWVAQQWLAGDGADPSGAAAGAGVVAAVSDGGRAERLAVTAAVDVVDGQHPSRS